MTNSCLGNVIADQKNVYWANCNYDFELCSMGLFHNVSSFVTLSMWSVTHTHTQPFNSLWSWLPGRPIPEETFTHLHPSWSSDILYQLPSFTMIRSILFVQLMCLTFVIDNLPPVLFGLPLGLGPCTLYFILHAFLHPVIIFLQHMRSVNIHMLSKTAQWHWNHPVVFELG